MSDEPIFDKPTFDKLLPIVSPDLPGLEELKERMEDVLKTGMVTNFSKNMKELEDETVKFLNVNYAVALPNATSGLMLLPKVLNLTGEVITTSFTFHSTSHALLWNNLEPVFADIDKETFNIDPKDVEMKITDKTSAILATHIFGNPCNISELERIAKKHNIYLLFDAAHAFGSTYCGKHIGGFGDAEVFSMSATKLLISGEGGVITTNNGEIADRLAIGRNYGDPGSYDCEFIGLNGKMQEMSAILGLKMLEKLNKHISHRNKLMGLFKDELKQVPGIQFQKITENSTSTFKDFGMLIHKEQFGIDRNQLADGLKKENVMTKKYFYPPIHLQRAYSKYGEKYRGKLPNTEFVSNNILCLPIYSHMTEETAIKICSAVKKVQHEAVNKKVVDKQDVNKQDVDKRNVDQQNKKRVLVAGGAGYIGSVLVRKLLAKGYGVRVFDEMLFGIESVQELLSNEDFELIVGNVTDKYIVTKAVKSCDAVIHLANLANDSSCDFNPEHAELVNYKGTEVLVKASKAAGVKRFIFASSAAIYGAAGDTLLDENSPADPVSLYSKIKLRCENLLNSEQTDNFTVCSLRKPTVYGYSPRMRFDLVVNILTALAVYEKKITIYGGDQWRPHVHVADIADAYIACLEAGKEKIAGQVFNVGSENYTIKEIARIFSEIIPGIEIVWANSVDSISYRIKHEKIERVLGFRPKMKVQDGIIEIKQMLDKGSVTNFKDIVHYNLRRLQSVL